MSEEAATYETKTDTKQVPSTNWIPHKDDGDGRGGVLLCEKVNYTAYEGNLVMPGETKQWAFRVIAMGEGVEGYNVGDLVITHRIFETPDVGCWIREKEVLGHLPVKHVPAKFLKKGGELPASARAYIYGSNQG
jgi:hypothetical protein